MPKGQGKAPKSRNHGCGMTRTLFESGPLTTCTASSEATKFPHSVPLEPGSGLQDNPLTHPSDAHQATRAGDTSQDELRSFVRACH